MKNISQLAIRVGGIMQKRFFVFTFFLLVLMNNALAYDENNMHPQINEEASRISINLDNILKSLEYTKGVDDSLGLNISKRIFEYFREGGTKEDETHCRSKFHFHDPLEPWSSAGLKVGFSSLIWAQKQLSFEPFLYFFIKF